MSSIDKPELPKASEVTPEKPQKGASENLAKKPHPEKPAEETCADSKIDAPRTFPEKEILDVIQDTLTKKQQIDKEAKSKIGIIGKIRNFLNTLFGNKPTSPEKANEIRPEKPKVSQVVRDKNNNILKLVAKSPDPDEKGAFTEMAFLIQGKHGQNQCSQATTVMHTYHNSKGEPESGHNVAEFKGGKWVHTPKLAA